MDSNLDRPMVVAVGAGLLQLLSDYLPTELTDKRESISSALLRALLVAAGTYVLTRLLY